MKYALFAAAMVCAPVVADAATLSFVGVGTTQELTGYDLSPDLDGQTIDYISGDVKSLANGLSVTGKAKVTFTYVGSEADNTNFSAGGFSFTEANTVGDFGSFVQLVDGLISFSFGTTLPAAALISNDGSANPISDMYAIGYKFISNTSYYVLFDDIAGGDRDFDDFALRIDVAAVPLPAGGLLLLGGLGALGAMRRRRAQA